MAVRNFIGGTPAVSQVATGTVGGTWALNNTIRTTILAEDGTTSLGSVTSTSTGSSIETDVIDVHVIDLNASVLAAFAAVTWAKGSSTTITATADTAGIPLSGGVSGGGVKVNMPTGSVPAGAGTYSGTFADTTANAGPNDYNTLANWVDGADPPVTAGALPTDGDAIKILPHVTDEDIAGNPVSYDILYGLNQSGSTAMASVRVPTSYRGIIGNSVNGYYLDIKSTLTIINSNCPALWIEGDHTAMTVAATANTAHALELGAGTITALRILGAGVAGTITVKDGNVITDAWLIDIGGADIKIGTSGTTIGTLKTNAPRVQVDRAVTTINATGGEVKHTTGAVTTINNDGARVFYNGRGTLTNLNNYTGIFDLDSNRQNAVTISNATIWGGAIANRSGLKNVTWSADVIVFGGIVQSETASTQTQV